jgi:hypothetical protein
LYAFLIFPMYATCCTHLSLLNFITLIIFGKVIKYIHHTRNISNISCRHSLHKL